MRKNLVDAIGILLGGFIQKHKVETSHTEFVGEVEQVILVPNSQSAN
jgi:hypothetical protein